MTRNLLFTVFFLLSICSNAQDSLQSRGDTTTLLHEIVVHGYSNDRPLSEIPAAIGYVNTASLERFSNTSILPAVNTIPGVRMEERSPGSYRFAIRGSSLRSPFGVRNVKMYWNGLPLTDGGGNTYLNLIDFNTVGNAEIIKGPGASLYGAGTGGVLLLNSPQITKGYDQVQVSAMGGSFGLRRYQTSVQMGSEKVNAFVNFTNQQAAGYRQQTSMRRNALNANLRFRLDRKSVITATVFYTDLYYQTPGGLTKAQFDADPRQARPSGALPGAIVQQAAVSNKTFYGGALYDYQWDGHWSTRVGLYGSLTDFVNPTINNYEIRKEYNWGGRTETQYEFEKTSWRGKLTFGGEYQYFHSPLADYANTGGVQGNIITDDRLHSTFGMLFAQAAIDLPRDFYLTLGGSDNFLNYELSRLTPGPPVDQKRNFSPVVSPRIALLKKIGNNFSLYGNVSKGFSPPSLAEVRPSTGTFNNGLNPEQGVSYELGIRGTLLKQISFDVTAYDFELNQTIVVQQQFNGQDYFINAGRTSQKGLETMVSWSPALPENTLFNSMRFWSSYTLNNYRFADYQKNAGGTLKDYSGKKLTGVSPNIFVGGMDLVLLKRVYANVTVNYVDKIPLNDNNDVFASSYFLVGMRLGYKPQIGKTVSLEIFGGVDNMGNRVYSLGNDLNAIGGRYYNAAAGRNFYFGLKFRALK